MFSLVSDTPPAISAAAAAGEPCPSEADTVRAAAAGDIRAFEHLVHTHSRRVYNFLAHLTRHTHDAEDLTQQTFIKAHRHLATFDCERPLINWLLTIARRTALNHFRDTKKWEPAIEEQIVSHEPSPARVLEQTERADDLWARARRILSEREFEVLWLRFAEDMSVEETARITGLTKIHVKVLVHRARQRLLKGETTA
jgi:RNA polymerase sigma-70 factor (ECF subfamily)